NSNEREFSRGRRGQWMRTFAGVRMPQGRFNNSRKPSCPRPISTTSVCFYKPPFTPPRFTGDRGTFPLHAGKTRNLPRSNPQLRFPAIHRTAVVSIIHQLLNYQGRDRPGRRWRRDELSDAIRITVVKISLNGSAPRLHEPRAVGLLRPQQKLHAVLIRFVFRIHADLSKNEQRLTGGISIALHVISLGPTAVLLL